VTSDPPLELTHAATVARLSSLRRPLLQEGYSKNKHFSQCGRSGHGPSGRPAILALCSPWRQCRHPTAARRSQGPPRGRPRCEDHEDPSPPVFGPTTHGHTPASAPSMPFPLSPLTSPYASTPPGGAEGAPRALHFSTPRSRRPSSVAEADVDALCAELDARVRSLQLARARDSSGGASAAGGGAGAGSGASQGPLLSGGNVPVTPAVHHRGGDLSRAPSSDWAGARHQLPPLPRHKSHRAKSHRPVTGGPTVLRGQALTLPLTLTLKPVTFSLSQDFRGVRHSSPAPMPSPWASFPPPGMVHHPGSPFISYGTLATLSPGGLGPAPGPAPSSHAPLHSFGGTPAVYTSGQPFSYSQRTPLSYSPFAGAPSSVPPAVSRVPLLRGSTQPAGRHPPGRPRPRRVLALSLRHPPPCLRPPHLGAPPPYLPPAGIDPGFDPPAWPAPVLETSPPPRDPGIWHTWGLAYQGLAHRAWHTGGWYTGGGRVGAAPAAEPLAGALEAEEECCERGTGGGWRWHRWGRECGP